MEFAPDGREYDERDRVTYDVIPDGVLRPYLIPIGCSPRSSWRPRIDRLRLSIGADNQVAPPRAECWQIDEAGPHSTAR